MTSWDLVNYIYIETQIKTLFSKLERILIKLYRQNVSLLLNQTYVNERQQPNYTHTHTHTYIYIYIYIYVYIYSHPQTDCFVVSQLFSVARHVRHFKLGLKPAQFYVRLKIVPLSPQSTYVSTGIIRYSVVAFACLHFALQDSRVLNSNKELCMTRAAAVNSFAKMLNHEGVEERH